MIHHLDDTVESVLNQIAIAKKLSHSDTPNSADSTDSKLSIEAPYISTTPTEADLERISSDLTSHAKNIEPIFDGGFADDTSVPEFIFSETADDPKFNVWVQFYPMLQGESERKIMAAKKEIAKDSNHSRLDIELVKNSITPKVMISVPKDNAGLSDTQFNVSRIQRIISELAKSGYDVLVDSSNDSSWDVYVPVQNSKFNVISLFKKVQELLDYPQFVKDNFIPPAVYESLLSKGYSDIRELTQGGTRKIFLANFNGIEDRVLKVDLPLKDISRPHARRHILRGCTTAQEIEVLKSIDNPEEHYIAPIRDVIDFSDSNLERKITIEKHIHGITIGEIYKFGNDKKIDAKADLEIFKQLVSAVTYLNETLGIYHRDMNVGNVILFKNSNGKTESRITDFTNACKKENVKQEELPTMGGHFLWYPPLLYAGKDRKYDDFAERYSLGVVLYYYLTGKYIVEIDSTNRVAKDFETGEVLIDQNGKFKTERYDEILKERVDSIEVFRRANLSKNADEIVPSRIMWGVLMGCLSLSNPCRAYESLNNLVNFERYCPPIKVPFEVLSNNCRNNSDNDSGNEVQGSLASNISK